MNNPASASIGIFALTPPFIPLQTSPITHPTADVGLSIVNYYQDPLGLVVLFGPWLGQVKYEVVDLLLNGSPTPVDSEIVMDDTKAVELRLPLGLLTDGVNTFQCRVKRQSGNEDSAELKVLYSVNAPAGEDPVAGVGHSRLSIDVNPKSVGPGEVAKGVILEMDYPHKRLYDTLTIDCGGQIIKHQIVPTPQDPNPETKPVVLTLFANDFANDPNNPQFPIRYNVVSQVGNLSGTSPQGQFTPHDHWSELCLIDVHLDRNELEMAILREILSENNDNPSIVDLGKLNGGPLWALIHLIASVWQPGDEIHLTFTAVDGNGTVVATYEVTLTIGPVPGQMSVDIPNVKIIADSKVHVVYEQIRGGKVIGVSNVAEAQVEGTALPELVMDVSPVFLSGTRYYVNPFPPQHPEYLWPSNPRVGSYVDRKATGGVGNIVYLSSDENVASVDQRGRVFARANGAATITAKDAANQTKSFTVTTSGQVQRVVFNWELRSWREATQIAAVDGGRLFSQSELQNNYLSFTPAAYQIPGKVHGSWTSTSAGTLGYWNVRWDGTTFTHLDRPDFTSIFVYMTP